MSNNGKSVDMSFLAAGNERLTPMPTGEETITVTIDLGEPFLRWVHNYFESADAQLAARNGDLRVSLEEFEAYVATLIYSRVEYSNRRRGIIHPTDTVRVPTFVHVTLAALGEVQSDEFGVKFVPFMARPENLLSHEQMENVSNRLAPLEYVGFSFALGYDRDRRGAQDLMMLQYIKEGMETGVFGHNRSANTAFAPVAYFLQLLQLTPLMGMRIRYGVPSTLDARLQSLARVDGK